ncbi:hypothetical protein FB451DRAFT_403284 [Mycena latifolia]|nr:hypothetical protein FB451DRAFT_403284 [Mycena latifolia]
MRYLHRTPRPPISNRRRGGTRLFARYSKLRVPSAALNPRGRARLMLNASGVTNGRAARGWKSTEADWRRAYPRLGKAEADGAAGASCATVRRAPSRNPVLLHRAHSAGCAGADSEWASIFGAQAFASSPTCLCPSLRWSNLSHLAVYDTTLPLPPALPLNQRRAPCPDADAPTKATSFTCRSLRQVKCEDMSRRRIVDRSLSSCLSPRWNAVRCG